MVLPSVEIVQTKAEQIMAAANMTHRDSDAPISKAQLEATITRLGKEAWNSRLTPTGSGAEILASIPGLTVRHFACTYPYK
jgi:hypothetical protein